jgi:serine/threonine protein kinase
MILVKLQDSMAARRGVCSSAGARTKNQFSSRFVDRRPIPTAEGAAEGGRSPGISRKHFNAPWFSIGDGPYPRYGIIHRNLKPADILVAADGQVKVVDFGVAMLLADPNAHADYRGLWLAPRLTCPNRRKANRPTRGWKFFVGATLYELREARLLRRFASGSASEILRHEPKPLGEAAPGLPHDLETIVNRCLRKDPLAFRHGGRPWSRGELC